MLKWITKKYSARQTAQQLYGSIVAQARTPEFYSRFAVPDSLEGRFEMMNLHMFIALRALKSHGETAEPHSTSLIELFFENLDGNFREMGVGDLVVPKKMRKFADAFYGRISAYDTALESESQENLEETIARNVYASELTTMQPSDKQACEQLASYVKQSITTLLSRPLDQLMAEGLNVKIEI